MAFAQAIGQTSDDGCAVIHQILNGIVLYRRDGNLRISAITNLDDEL